MGGISSEAHPPSTTMGAILTLTGKAGRESYSNQEIFEVYLSTVAVKKKKRYKSKHLCARIHLLQLCKGKPSGWMLKH